MNLFDIILLAIALAMDCFAVSIISGVITSSQSSVAQGFGTYKEIRMAFFFGFFQAMMPLVGWLCVSHFQSMIEAFDHWIAFSLLLLIGGNMIREAFGPEEEQHFNPANLQTQLLLAIATSIDALAVGITFAFLDVNLFLAISIIGIITFTLSVIGVIIGSSVGNKFEKKAEFIGGVILILIGLKILLEHLGVLY